MIIASTTEMTDDLRKLRYGSLMTRCAMSLIRMVMSPFKITAPAPKIPEVNASTSCSESFLNGRRTWLPSLHLYSSLNTLTMRSPWKWSALTMTGWNKTGAIIMLNWAGARQSDLDGLLAVRWTGSAHERNARLQTRIGRPKLSVFGCSTVQASRIPRLQWKGGYTGMSRDSWTEKLGHFPLWRAFLDYCKQEKSDRGKNCAT